MTGTTKRGGPRKGAGPKPKHGEPMKPRQIRMTDSQNEDLKLVTHEVARTLISAEAERLRKERK